MFWEKLWGMWYRRHWWIDKLLSRFFPEEILAEKRWNRRFEARQQRFWKQFLGHSSLVRPLNALERQKLMEYERDYTNIRVFVFQSNAPIGGLCIDFARFLDAQRKKDKDTCVVLYFERLLKRNYMTPNKYLSDKLQTLCEAITEETYPFWREYLTKKRQQVSVITSSNEIKQQYQESTLFFKMGEIAKKEIRFSFSEEEEQEGYNAIRRIGITNPYICIFARDSRYNNEIRLNGSAMYDLRNFDINVFKKTTQYFWEKQVQSVRMGQVVVTEYCCEGAIDYANHGRTDFLDAFIFKGCLFSIGCASGISSFSFLMNTPWVLINMHQVLNFGDRSMDFALGIYVKYYDPRCKRYLTLKEIAEMQIRFHSLIEMPAPTNNMLPYDDYVRQHYEIVYNTPDEILDVAKEMEAILNHTESYSLHDEELQHKYRGQICKFLSMYPTVICPFVCRIGMQWLRDNEWFLE